MLRRPLALLSLSLSLRDLRLDGGVIVLIGTTAEPVQSAAQPAAQLGELRSIRYYQIWD